MKRIHSIVIAACILINSGIAAFGAAAPDTCAKPVLSSGSSQLSKLFSSMRLPLAAMNNQMQNNNPLVPNMRVCPKPETGADACAAKKIAIPSNNKTLNMDKGESGGPAAELARLYSASFERPRIFPPPGFETRVNSLYLQYFVFLAKANLPWGIVISQKG